MKTLSLFLFGFIVSTQSFANPTCPDLAGKFKEATTKSEQSNSQTQGGGVTTFSWNGLTPIVLDGKTKSGADYTRMCTDTQIVLNLSSQIILEKTLAGYNVITGGQIIETFIKE